MNTTDNKQSMNRREWLRSIGRYGTLGTLALSAALLASADSADQDNTFNCYNSKRIPEILCRNCSSYASCQNPEAIASNKDMK